MSLAQQALPLWLALEAEAGERLLNLTGSIDLGAIEPQRHALAACGAAFDILDAAEVELRWPLVVPAGGQVLFQPDGGWIRADAALRALHASATAAGAEVLEGTPAEEVTSDAGGVRVAGLRARAAVVAAGAWTPSLVELDARPTVETVTFFSLEDSVELPAVLDQTTSAQTGFEAYALPSPGDGLKVGFHASGPSADVDACGRPDAAVVEWATAWATSRLAAASRLLRAETCLYTGLPGERFALERRGRVIVGSACSGHGFKFAPLVGDRLAALAAEAIA